MINHYDDPDFFYPDYWKSRDYENSSEIIAIQRLLHSRRFNTAADIGGGYGRLIPYLQPFSQKILLVEPSSKQRKIAAKYIDGKFIIDGTAQKTNLPGNSLGLVTLIRVMHHISDPNPVFGEINRILKPGGLFILEFANSYNFKSRFLSFFRGQPILLAPMDKRSHANIHKKTIDFVNHHPYTILRQLTSHNFTLLKTLSVSNFRNSFFKNIIPPKTLLILEKYSQGILSHIYFGPSIFILAQKSP